MSKKYEKIGKLTFIDSHTTFCNDRQEKMKEDFADDDPRCACAFLKEYAQRRLRRKETVNEKAM